MAAEGIYPLSTQDGKAIPLDIVKPRGLTSFAFVESVAEDITIPVGYELCWVFATAACVLKIGTSDLPTTLVEGTDYADTMYIPAETPTTVLLTPGAASLLGLANGTLYINRISQWAALIQSKQSSVG